MPTDKRTRHDFFKLLLGHVKRPQDQRLLEEYIKHGCNSSATAGAMGKNKSTISRAIKKIEIEAFRKGLPHNGLPPLDLPSPFTIGKQTIAMKGDGTVSQVWFKLNTDPELAERWVDQVIETLNNRIPRAPSIEAPRFNSLNQLLIIAEGDPHAGMFAAAKECGAEFNLQVYQDTCYAAIDALMAETPSCEECLYIDTGDTLHVPDNKSRTPNSGHVLDTVSRILDMVDANLQIKLYFIEALLKKHGWVTVRINPGNHDGHMATMISKILSAYYRNESRVIIDTSPNPYFYKKYKNVMVCSTHGDGPKISDIGKIMAVDERKMWGATEHKVAIFGHFHHANSQDVHTVRTFVAPTLAPNDAHHHAKGYRSTREIMAIRYDMRWGFRGTVNVSEQYAKYVARKTTAKSSC